MTFLRRRRALLPVLAVLALTAAPAAAQQDVPDTGGRVYGLVGGGLGDGTFIATGAGAGLRLTPHIGLDLELTHLSDRGGTTTDIPWFGGISVFGATSTATVAEDFPPIGVDDYLFPPVRFEDRGRDLTTFLTKFTAEFPIADGLLFPYLTGGGGVGRVTEHFGIILDPIPWLPLDHGPSTAQANAARDAGGTVYSSDFSTSFTGPFRVLRTRTRPRARRRGRRATVARIRRRRRHPLVADSSQLRNPRHGSGDRAGELPVLN